MENDQNDIPSSEGAEPEPMSNNFDDINEPTITNAESDCRINCTDSQSLRNILDVTINQLEELPDRFNLTGDSRSEFISVLFESFKNALRENILVNGLPFMIDESKKLSLSERNDHSHMVHDVLYGKLSKKVSDIAQNRKFYAEQCYRIQKIEMKHEIQNLKRTEVTDSNLQLATPYDNPSFKSSNKGQTCHKTFSEFCESFSTMQETVQHKLQELEKVAMKFSAVKEIQKSQKDCSKFNKEKMTSAPIFVDGLNAGIHREDPEKKFSNDQDARDPIKEMNGVVINGSQIHVDHSCNNES